MPFIPKRRLLMGSPKHQKTLLGILLLLLFCSAVYLSGNAPAATENKAAGPELAAGIQAGSALAAQHCQSCHLLPDPALLDKENWQTALAKMGPLLGVFFHQDQAYPIYTDIDQSQYPDRAAMDAAQWQHILDYYTATAPAALPAQKRTQAIKRQLPFFSIERPAPSFYRHGNTASFVRIDTLVKPHRLFISRATSNTLFLLNEKLQLLDSLRTGGPLVDMDFQGGKVTASIIGRDLFGNNARQGALLDLQISRRGKIQAGTQPLFDALARPLQVTTADLNGDRKQDYLVCAFGNMNGSLLWMENKGGGNYVRHALRAVAGATKAIVEDVNHDGLPDIWALFSQAEEGVFLFTNKGHGAFDARQVVRFPPSYGSSSFELVDFNHDGFSDMVYTCGDRGDGINQLKPYHGVYVLLNNGSNAFAVRYFFPINGCMKAMARDFDRDGDLDIAAIGFFTDNRQPEEGFVYLQNRGKWDFTPYALPVETNFSKATTMDVADLDGDGRLDIVLGHGFIGTKAQDERKPLFLVLKNRL